MFAIVENDEECPPRQMARQSVEWFRIVADFDAENGGGGLEQQIGVFQICQLDKPDAIGELGRAPAGGVQRKFGLSDAARSRQGEKTPAFEELRRDTKLFAPANQPGTFDAVAGPGRAEISRSAFVRPRWVRHLRTLNLRREAIAMSLLVDDAFVTDDPAQRIDVDIERVVGDGGSAPYARNQIVFGNDGTRLFDKGHEKANIRRAQEYRNAVRIEAALGGVQCEPSETVQLAHFPT